MAPETKELQADELAARGKLPHPDDVTTVDDVPADGTPWDEAPPYDDGDAPGQWGEVGGGAEAHAADREAAGRKTREGPSDRAARCALRPWVSVAPGWVTEAPPPRAYLLHDYADRELGNRGPGMLPRGKVGILAARGGVGKTYALCGLALALVTRRPWLGRFPVGEGLYRHVAMILGEEDAAEVHRRLHAQAAAMSMGPEDAERVAGILVLPGAGLADLALTQGDDEGRGPDTPFARELFDYLAAEAGDGWDAVILDPLSRFAGPDVETDNAAATRLIQVLERFAELPGNPSVIIAHHNRKGGDADAAEKDPEDLASEVRGSSAIVDGARWVGVLGPVKRPDSPKGRELPAFARFGVGKSNYAAFPRSLSPKGLLLVKPSDGGLREASKEEERALADAKVEAKKLVQRSKNGEEGDDVASSPGGREGPKGGPTKPSGYG